MQQHNDDQVMQNMGKAGIGKAKGAAKGMMIKGAKIAGKVVVLAIKKLLLLLAPYLVVVAGCVLLAFFVYATIFLLPRYITEKISDGTVPLNDSAKSVFHENGAMKDYSAIFAYGLNDDEYLFEDDLKLYETYLELVENLDPELVEHIKTTAEEVCQQRGSDSSAGLNETQCSSPSTLADNIIRDSMDDIRSQASRYKLSWGLLASIDRIMGDPSLHDESTSIGNRNPQPEIHYAALKPHFNDWQYLKENYEVSRQVHVKRVVRDTETGEIINEYWEWETDHDLNEKHRMLLKEVDTFESNYSMEWDILEVRIDKEAVRVKNTQTSKVIFTATPDTPSQEVPLKYKDHYDKMLKALKTEKRINPETGQPYHKNLWWQETYAEFKTFQKSGESMGRFMDVVEEYGISSDFEIEFVMHLAQSFDPQFYWDRAEVYHVGDSYVATTERYFMGEAGFLCWPVPQYNRVSSPFGNRIHPILKERRFHSGIDVPAPQGVPVLSAMNGVVIFSGTMGGYGRTIIVDHGDVKTLYGHMHRLEVSRGTEVMGGDLIGRVGSTGMSSGNHLHFEFRKLQGGREVFIDPVEYFEKATEDGLY